MISLVSTVSLAGLRRYVRRNQVEANLGEKRLLRWITAEAIWRKSPVLATSLSRELYTGVLVWDIRPADHLWVCTGLHVDQRCRGQSVGRLLWREWRTRAGQTPVAFLARTVAGLRFAVHSGLSAVRTTEAGYVWCESAPVTAWPPEVAGRILALPDDLDAAPDPGYRRGELN